MRLAHRLWPLLAAVLLVASASQAAAPAADLLAVYAQARAADPVLAGERATRGVQDEAAVQARAGLLPQWTLSIDERSERQGGQSDRNGGVLSRVSQVVFDLGLLKRNESARTLLSARDASVQAAEQELCLRVATAYFGALGAQAALATAEANEDALQQQVRQSESRYAAGLAALADVELARTYLAQAKGGTVQARRALADAREALSEITGQPATALKPLIERFDAGPPSPADPQAWVERARQANPQLAALRLQFDASRLDVDAARAGHLPTLSLGLDTERRHHDGGVDGRLKSTLGLTLRVPLFAGGSTQSQVRQAVYRRDAAREALEQRERRVARDTLAQYEGVLSGMALIASTREAVESAERALAAIRVGQELGTRSMTDLLLALQTLANARNAHTQARHQYLLAKLALQFDAGALGEAELAAVNTLLQERNS